MGKYIVTNKLPEQEELHHRFTYDGKNLIWKNTIFKDMIGSVAGSVNKRSGYRTIRLREKDCYAHRLVWIFVYGSISGNIDHINHDKLDNSIENLRLVSHGENVKNLSLYSNSNNPFTGVTWNKAAKKWRVYIRHGGKDVNLGYFNDLTEAIATRLTANEHYGFHENHGLL